MSFETQQTEQYENIKNTLVQEDKEFDDFMQNLYGTVKISDEEKLDLQKQELKGILTNKFDNLKSTDPDTQTVTDYVNIGNGGNYITDVNKFFLASLKDAEGNLDDAKLNDFVFACLDVSQGFDIGNNTFIDLKMGHFSPEIGKAQNKINNQLESMEIENAKILLDDKIAESSNYIDGLNTELDDFIDITDKLINELTQEKQDLNPDNQPIDNLPADVKQEIQFIDQHIADVSEEISTVYEAKSLFEKQVMQTSLLGINFNKDFYDTYYESVYGSDGTLDHIGINQDIEEIFDIQTQSYGQNVQQTRSITQNLGSDYGNSVVNGWSWNNGPYSDATFVGNRGKVFNRRYMSIPSKLNTIDTDGDGEGDLLDMPQYQDFNDFLKTGLGNYNQTKLISNDLLRNNPDLYLKSFTKINNLFGSNSSGFDNAFTGFLAGKHFDGKNGNPDTNIHATLLGKVTPGGNTVGTYASLKYFRGNFGAVVQYVGSLLEDPDDPDKMALASNIMLLLGYANKSVSNQFYVNKVIGADGSNATSLGLQNQFKLPNSTITVTSNAGITLPQDINGNTSSDFYAMEGGTGAAVNTGVNLTYNAGNFGLMGGLTTNTQFTNGYIDNKNIFVETPTSATNINFMTLLNYTLNKHVSFQGTVYLGSKNKTKSGQFSLLYSF